MVWPQYLITLPDDTGHRFQVPSTSTFHCWRLFMWSVSNIMDRKFNNVPLCQTFILMYCSFSIIGIAWVLRNDKNQDMSVWSHKGCKLLPFVGKFSVITVYREQYVRWGRGSWSFVRWRFLLIWRRHDTIRLPINMIRTLQSQHPTSSNYQQCTHDWPRHKGLSLPANQRTQARAR